MLIDEFQLKDKAIKNARILLILEIQYRIGVYQEKLRKFALII